MRQLYLFLFFTTYIGSSYAQTNIDHRRISNQNVAEARTLSKKDKKGALIYIDTYQDNQMDSLYLELMLVKANILQKEGSHHELMKFYNSLINNIKDDARLYSKIRYSQGTYLKHNGRYKEIDSIYAVDIEKYKSMDDNKALADIYVGLSNSLTRQSRFKEAISILDTSISISKTIGDTSILVKSLINRGVCQSYIGQLDSSIIHYNAALDIARLKKDTMTMAKSLMNLGNVYNRLKESDTAQDYHRKALSYYRLLDSKQNIVFTLANLGVTFEQKENGDSAVYYYSQALDEAKPLCNKRLISKLTGSLGSAYMINGEHEKSENYLLEALTEEKTPHTRATYYERLGIINRKKGNFDKALAYHEKSYELGVKTGDLSMQRTSLGFLSKVHNKKNDHKKAYDYKIREIKLTDSLFNIEKEKIAKDFNTKYETRVKQDSIQLLSAESYNKTLSISNQRRALWTLGVTLLSAILLGGLFYRQSRERKRKNALLTKQRDQIDTLHRDLAHRVKNNLFFVSSLLKMQADQTESTEARDAIKEGESRVEAMSILHRKLNTGNETKVEIDAYIKELCENLKTIFPIKDKSVAFDILVDKMTVDADYAMRVGLIINELVSNSFKHAFDNVTQPKISVRMYSSENTDELSYQDNGVGLSDKKERRKGSMGMQLIDMLTRDMDGTLLLDGSNGMNYHFKFSHQ